MRQEKILISEQGQKEYKILDGIIVSLFIVFLLSLSNSIFVNQIGYFGALLLILLKAFLTKKNPFSKTGLELAFVLYIVAEILSLIFSEYKAQAFHHLTKRALLIPVVYTTIASTTSFRLGKIYFKLFVFGALVTALIYLYFSIQFYFSNQYVLTQSGPSLFQNPITASEIISFVVLFFFAFIINEKTGWKTKLLLYLGFAISLLMLIATFKRTGWMGVAAGIILILIIKRKWIILAPILIGGVLLFVLDKNESSVSVYDFRGTNAEKLFSFKTEGRAFTISDVDSFFTVSDYENGILFYDDSTLIKRIETPSPAVVFMQISDSVFLSQLIDTRFLIYKRQNEDFELVNEILPPGETKDFKLLGNSLYTLDSDSGLTYYESIVGETKSIRLPEFKKYRWLFVDSSYFYFVSFNDGVSVYLKAGMLPGTKVTQKETGPVNRVLLFDHNLFISNSGGLYLFTMEGNELVLKDQMKELKLVHRMVGYEDEFLVLNSDGSIYKLDIDTEQKISIQAKDKLLPNPTNFHYADGKLYCNYVKRGRMLSFFDPYLQQNFTRLALWRAGWEIFKDYPLFGVGDIGIEKYYVHYKQPYDKEIHGHLHNNYFHFLATLGLFGFLAIMYLFIMIIIKISRIYKSTKGKTFIASYSLGTLAAFVNILVAGLSELNFWDHEIATLIYFTIGLNIALYMHFRKEEKEMA